MRAWLADGREVASSSSAAACFGDRDYALGTRAVSAKEACS